MYEMDVWWLFEGSKFKQLIHTIPPPSEFYLSYCNSNNWYQSLVLWKRSFAALRKYLENGSLQVGKDYWELKDWNTTCPTSTQGGKKWIETFIEEKKGIEYSKKETQYQEEDTTGLFEDDN